MAHEGPSVPKTESLEDSSRGAESMQRGFRIGAAVTVPRVLWAMVAFGVAGLVQAQPQVDGLWETRPETMTINPVHAGLLGTGRVLVIAGSGNDPKETNYRTAVWDPVSGEIHVQSIPWDVWCNGMSFLPDGRALITGGSNPYPRNNFSGLRNTTIFDPVTSVFTRVEDMAHGRWYPTNISLPDGRTATFSGYDETGRSNRTFEIYTMGGGWGPANPLDWPATLKNYPRAHLTPDGDIFFSGEQRESHRLNPVTGQWTRNVAITNYAQTRRYGSSVLLGLRPPDYAARILIAGGGVGFEATNTAEVIDLSATPLEWKWTDALNHKRVQQNSVLLPNGRVLAVGGSTKNNVAEGSGRIAELYDPETGVWTDVAPQAFWRFYHSLALLLPDGRVASLGGNPKQLVYEKHIEIYSPPYLFTSSGALAPRPLVTSVPEEIGYQDGDADVFEVKTPAPEAIAEAVLMRPGANTHAFDMEQRLVELEIVSAQGGKLSLKEPPNPNIAPPGYYMLFLLDSAGVPSEAKFLRLGDGLSHPIPSPPAPPSSPGTPSPGTPSPGSPPVLTAGSAPDCFGEAATVFVADGIIVGGPDHGLPYGGRLRGTEGADVIVGTDGNDRIEGGGGNDRICGGPGHDRIRGGKGNDHLFGGAGRDILRGGAGSDRCDGGPGADKIWSCGRAVRR